MKSFFSLFGAQQEPPSISLGMFSGLKEVSKDGRLKTEKKRGCLYVVDGLDGAFFSSDQMGSLHNRWRSALRLMPGEEVQIIFRKRVAFAEWVEEQLKQAFLGNHAYGRRILLDRLSEQVFEMSQEEPRLLSQKILVCFWTREEMSDKDFAEKRTLFQSQLSSFGFRAQSLDREGVEKEIKVSAQDLASVEEGELELPQLKIEAGQVRVNQDRFRALELVKLPESFTELGMIQSLTSLPIPLDLSVRLKAKELGPVITRLERKKNLLAGQKANRASESPQIESQLEQINQVMRSLADKSEGVYEMQVTLGLRLPESLGVFQRKALSRLSRAAARMNFCELEEATLGTFDSYLECIPGFSGRNIQKHTVLGSNAIHFLPFFRPSSGDARPVLSFQTRNASLYGIDPVSSHLANYNWLVSGTSGSGKSFFVNSLLAQSTSIDPNIFIVDIGGSYNKLTQFLGGRVMSLEPGQGFQVSPFFLPKSSDPKEERLRRQHIYQIFLEITRIDGQLPGIEVRQVLWDALQELFDAETLPERPISRLLEIVSKVSSSQNQQLKLLLQPWCEDGFFGQFLDTNRELMTEDRILTFDLKGLTEFEDLSRVVQLIVCASMWARIRQAGQKNRFSWIVLDEVAFSLLKTQPQFVDELVSTIRKYFGGAVIVVQDLEKVTANLAGSSILQNTQTKAILQQRGNPKNYSETLDLNEVDMSAIESLQRQKGQFSDVFLIRDQERTVIRHVPSTLEYWLSTSAPEDSQVFRSEMEQMRGNFQENVLQFIDRRQEGS